MNAIARFREALLREKERDLRPIIGARVSGELFRQINNEALEMMTPEQIIAAKGDPLRVRTLFGIPLIIGTSDDILFDH